MAAVMSDRRAQLIATRGQGSHINGLSRRRVAWLHGGRGGGVAAHDVSRLLGATADSTTPSTHYQHRTRGVQSARCRHKSVQLCRVLCASVTLLCTCNEREHTAGTCKCVSERFAGCIEVTSSGAAPDGPESALLWCWIHLLLPCCCLQYWVHHHHVPTWLCAQALCSSNDDDDRTTKSLSDLHSQENHAQSGSSRLRSCTCAYWELPVSGTSL